MEKLVCVEGVAAPFVLANVDTDMLIPKQFLKSPSRTGYGPALFYELRYFPDGSERPDFILNMDGYRNARILIGGDNFGCGSAREHAPWAVAQYGIRCVIAPSFGDIFENNCFLNSILPIRLDRAVVERIARLVEHPATSWIKVSLQEQTLQLADGQIISFSIDPYKRHNLLEGRDAIASTLLYENDIAEFEAGHWFENPWLHPLVIRDSTQKERDL
jgi:3-isopropylmalate/(R)-2-methylmalate dehydratase small subunit